MGPHTSFRFRSPEGPRLLARVRLELVELGTAGRESLRRGIAGPCPLGVAGCPCEGVTRPDLPTGGVSLGATVELATALLLRFVHILRAEASGGQRMSGTNVSPGAPRGSA